MSGMKQEFNENWISELKLAKKIEAGEKLWLRIRNTRVKNQLKAVDYDFSLWKKRASGCAIASLILTLGVMLWIYYPFTIPAKPTKALSNQNALYDTEVYEKGHVVVSNLEDELESFLLASLDVFSNSYDNVDSDLFNPYSEDESQN